MTIELYVSAFIMGLLGSVHCLGMCGGITMALSQGVSQERKTFLTINYQASRILSYSLLGALLASFSSLLSKLTPFPILPILSGILMILLGFYLLNMGAALIALEKIGHKLWAKLAPIQRRFIPIKKPQQAIAVGLLWGFLPCGLVYSALALAVTAHNPLDGFMTMLAFGLGTLPALIGIGWMSQTLLNTLKKPWIRQAFAVLFIAWGAFTIVQVFLAGKHQHTTVPSQQNPIHHNHELLHKQTALPLEQHMDLRIIYSMNKANNFPPKSSNNAILKRWSQPSSKAIL